MLIDDISFQSGVNNLRGTVLKHDQASVPTILSLHGAGKSNRHRMRYILDHLAKHNLSSICFDFSGHGESTGTLEQSSLAKRRQEAISAYQFLDNEKNITVIGSSMGGHIAATLVDQLPIKTLILFCPAAYSSKAEDLVFDETFTQTIRQPGSYMDSLAFKKLESFKGNLLLICGTNDQVIPKEILDNYLGRATKTARKELLWIEGANHQIHPWLEQHESDLDCVLGKIYDFMETVKIVI